MTRILLMLGLVLGAACLRAQATHDFNLWKGLILEKTFWKGRLQASLNEEVRLGNNLAVLSNNFTDLSIHYKLVKRLRIGLGYRYAVRPEINTHRIYSDLSWNAKLHDRLKLTLRTRLQYQQSPVEYETLLRQRINLTYNIPDNKLEPYVGGEPFFRLSGIEPGFDAYRLMAGFSYPIRKKVELRMGYALQHELRDPTPDIDHILQVRLTVDLDKGDEREADPEVGW